MRRCKHDIICALLKGARQGSLQTPLMYATKTNYKQLVRYLKILNDMGLVKKKGRLWFTTEQGKRFIELFDAVATLTEGSGDE